MANLEDLLDAADLGDEARTLRESNAYKRSMEHIKNSITTAITSSSPNEHEERERLYGLHWAADKLDMTLEQMAVRGKMARNDIEKRQDDNG